MKTPIEAVIEQIQKSPNETLTKTNVLHCLNSFLETEQEHLEGMTDCLNETFKSMGVRGISGRELFNRRYRGVVKNNKLI